MADETDARVAVYLDFDNIVISWYDRVHGRNAYSKDRQRIADDPHDAEVAERLSRAVIDVGAIIDYASSFGTLVLTRAYADWSSPVNAEYRSQLVARAVDLVQLFPAAAYAKNGADIRLAVDAVEDMFRLPDLTHVVIVAGDSDYVPLAQRCKRLGRYVIGVGVAGSTAKSLAAACDQFESYDSLPGVDRLIIEKRAAKQRSTPKADAAQTAAPETSDTKDPEPEPAQKPAAKRRNTKKAPAVPADDDIDLTSEEQIEASALLIRALRLGHDKADADEWLHSSAIKTQMRRMDPSFSEKALGYRSFSDFLKSRDDIAELSETGHERQVRLKGD
ncbi:MULTISPECIES: NYN domain-containing protein [unclassified Microbacterium]|uniref:NYN domain-containing protein n=1 Tax=unclassified Microbacterium TaxID=2609290 RepID=UPI0012F8DF69|nr:NYN domain-containing protein [Microbacterium sp. MAH-37]MVQ41173.1 NYN domain-containing protein [Microbacterium sp. MAH-37]